MTTLPTDKELAARLNDAAEALKPFASVARRAPDKIGNPEVVVAVIKDEGRWTIHLSLDDLRRAADAMRRLSLPTPDARADDPHGISNYVEGPRHTVPIPDARGAVDRSEEMRAAIIALVENAVFKATEDERVKDRRIRMSVDELVIKIAAIKLPASAWRTMDSAPRDDDILGYWRKSNCYAVVRWFNGHDDIAGGWMDESGDVSAPTHWQPLPTPPRDEKGGA